MICREWTAFALLATALASVHATYAVTSVLYFTRGWLGEPLMFALDGAAIVLPLVLAAYFTWRARRARVATSFVGIFSLAYALPFFSFAYLFTYYVGM